MKEIFYYLAACPTPVPHNKKLSYGRWHGLELSSGVYAWQWFDTRTTQSRVIAPVAKSGEKFAQKTGQGGVKGV